MRQAAKKSAGNLCAEIQESFPVGPLQAAYPQGPLSALAVNTSATLVFLLTWRLPFGGLPRVRGESGLSPALVTCEKTSFGYACGVGSSDPARQFQKCCLEAGVVSGLFLFPRPLPPPC